MARKWWSVVGLLILVVPLFVPVETGVAPAAAHPAGSTLQQASFTPLDRVAYTAENNTQHPRAVIAPNQDLHVTWMDGTRSPKKNWPAYATGQYQAWSGVETPHQGKTGQDDTRPFIALDAAGTVHLVWAASYSGTNPYDIWYARKPAGGDWSQPQNLSDETANTVYPSMVVDSQGGLWVAWQATADVLTKVSVCYIPAGGSACSSITPLPGDPATDDQNPMLAIDDDDVLYVVWRRKCTAPGCSPGAYFDAFFSTYAGGVWSDPYNLSATALHNSYYPKVAVNDTGGVLVVWEEEKSETAFQIRFRRRPQGSGDWLADVPVTPPDQKALWPSIAADGCNIYMVWDQQDPGTDAEILFSDSTDCGATWPAGLNVSKNDKSSFWPWIVAGTPGQVHVFWQDNEPGQPDIYYARGTVPIPSVPPAGRVDIAAIQPPASTTYTNLLDVDLYFTATARPGDPLEMRYANQSDFGDNPTWFPYESLKTSWRLAGDIASCGARTVFAQYRVGGTGLTSPVYTDSIFYDGSIMATMVLNEDKPYTNRTAVMVNSEDQEAQAGCSGLEAMAFWEEGLTQTVWISYFPRLYFFLAPEGGNTRTVHTVYRDRAGNTGALADSITFDLTPPYDGAVPVLNGGISQTHDLVISVTGLLAADDESGMAGAWLSNRADDTGQVEAYCSVPPCAYEWNLAYGGPPRQLPEQHTVYVRYEDDAGYGAFPGNMTAAYTASIGVSGITVAYLPLVLVGAAGSRPSTPWAPGPGESGLVLLAESVQVGTGEDVLFWLAAQWAEDGTLAGELRLTLPAGLRAVRAWSAYGRLLQMDDHLVVSAEQATSQQTPWLLVQAHVEGTADPLLVQGEMSGTGGIVWTVASRLGTRW